MVKELNIMRMVERYMRVRLESEFKELKTEVHHLKSDVGEIKHFSNMHSRRHLDD